jgi:hypothetical protein
MTSAWITSLACLKCAREPYALVVLTVLEHEDAHRDTSLDLHVQGRAGERVQELEVFPPSAAQALRAQDVDVGRAHRHDEAHTIAGDGAHSSSGAGC